MSDERWNPENQGKQFSDDSNIVDSTAEVVDEAGGTASGGYSNSYGADSDSAAGNGTYYSDSTVYGTDQEAGSQYETYSAGSSAGSTYSHADHGSATGNGSYRYESSNHEYYQGDNYGSSVGGGSGRGSGGRGKGFLAVVLAVVLGVCVGAGFWGVHRYVGKSDGAAETAVTDSADKNGSELTGEKKEEADQKAAADNAGNEQQAQQPGNDAAAQQQADNDAAAQQQTDNDAAAQQQADNDAAAQQQTDNDTAAQQQADNDAAAQQQSEASTASTETLQNEAGLIIADAATPDTGLTKMVDQVMPSIVSVYNDFTEEVQNFYGQTFTRQGESTGSGIIIGKTDTELLIVTNNHVVEGADNLRVLFIDQETCDAELKGTNPSNDLAVIAVPLDNLKETTQSMIRVATLGNSDNLKIGEDVIAIGNALGYGQSVTTGIVSAINREISDETITGTFIQTDAAINPGNSGGALVNINGHVIGINSSKIGGSTVEGMGFAIPISRAIPIIEELMSRDTLTKVDENERGTIGISGATVTSDVSKAYNMPKGVYVSQILENGGAAGSDLREGDIITALNGQEITSMEDLQKQLAYYKAGTEVTLTVQRQDGNGSYAETSVKVTLGTRESIQSQGQQNQEQQDQGHQGAFGGQQGAPDGEQDTPDEQGGQDEQNGYNNQSGSDEESREDRGAYNPFEQFGFPFGF